MSSLEQELADYRKYCGSPTGVTCTICEQPIYGSMTGVGDGTGQRFACRSCYERRENNKYAAEEKKAIAAMDNGADETRWPSGLTAVDALIAENAKLTEILNDIKAQLTNVPGEYHDIFDMLQVVLEKDAKSVEKIDKLRLELNKYKAFTRSVETNWDCDTGANGIHPDYCRACEAKRLLEAVIPVTDNEVKTELDKQIAEAAKVPSLIAEIAVLQDVFKKTVKAMQTVPLNPGWDGNKIRDFIANEIKVIRDILAKARQ